jgi:hypothetical protein
MQGPVTLCSFIVRTAFDGNVSFANHAATCTVSGHGGQIRDLDGDEVDGYDECMIQAPLEKITIDVQKVICPVDYQQSGVINDDVRCFANLITG